MVSYINFQGGTHSPSLCHLVIELWEWCLQRDIHLLASYIPGEDNLVADFLSRGKFLPSEWTLNPSIFRRICQILSPQLEIDLFRVHSQLSSSQVLCPLQGSSGLEGGPTFLPVDRPPSVCLPTILHSSRNLGEDCSRRSRRGSGSSVLASTALVPTVTVSSGGLPQVSPSSLTQPMSHQPHPRLESLLLSLWPLSGRKVCRQVFLSELQNSQQRLLESPHILLTIPSWNASSSGLKVSLVTPLLPL